VVQIEMMGRCCEVRRARLGCIRERIGVGADEAFTAGIWGRATVCEGVEDRLSEETGGVMGCLFWQDADADADARCMHALWCPVHLSLSSSCSTHARLAH
jgi:hypothetical protein